MALTDEQRAAAEDAYWQRFPLPLEAYLAATERAQEAVDAAVGETRRCKKLSLDYANHNKRLLDENAKLRDAYHEGVIEGMRRFAWWQDGVEMVGSCGTTLQKAVADYKKETRDGTE